MKYLMLAVCLFMVGCGRPKMYQVENAKKLFPNSKVGEANCTEWELVVITQNGDVYLLDTYNNFGSKMEDYEKVSFGE